MKKRENNKNNRESEKSEIKQNKGKDKIGEEIK